MPRMTGHTFQVGMHDAGAFEVVGFSGAEHLSRLFEHTVEVKALGGEQVSAAVLPGQKAHLTLQLPDAAPRHFHGVVAQCESLGGNSYRLHLVPGLWGCGLVQRSRLFQDLSVPQVVESVLNEAGIDFQSSLTRSYPKEELCVHFLSRLLEREGIFYRFEQTGDGHTLVLQDDGADPEHAPLELHPQAQGRNELLFEDAAGREQVKLHAQREGLFRTEHDKAQQVRASEALEVGAHRRVQVEGNQELVVRQSEELRIGGSQSNSIAAERAVAVEADEVDTVEGPQAQTVAVNHGLRVAQAASEQVGEHKALLVGGVYALTVGQHFGTNSLSSSAGADALQDVGGSTQQDVTGRAAFQGGEFLLEARDQLTVLVGGKLVLRLEKSGAVQFFAKQLVLAGSGVTVKGSKVSKMAAASSPGATATKKKAKEVQDEGKGSVTLTMDGDASHPAHRDDTFTLKSADGSFSQKKSARSGAKGGGMELTFSGVPKDQKLTLEVTSGSHRHVVFQDVAFADLDGLTATSGEG